MTNPKSLAIERFAVDRPDVPVTTDVIARCATDPPVVVASLMDAARPLVTTGARICDLGFGGGWLLDQLVREFPRCALHGLDLSPPFARAAHARHGDTIRIVLGDMERLPLKDAVLDVAYTCWTLYFMDDIDAALDEIRRTIRPGGRLIAATVAHDNMLEYTEMAAQATQRALGRGIPPDIGDRFEMENGDDFMSRHFDRVDVVDWHGELTMSSLDDAVALWDPYGDTSLIGDNRARAVDALRDIAAARLNRDGAIRLRRHSGAFIATR